MKTGTASPVALVTGAAGGLGRELVAEFARQGWRVAAGYHSTRPNYADATVSVLPLDVTEPEVIQRTVCEVEARWGRIDALVNNAGITIDQPLWQLTPADWDQVIAVNLTGAANCARAVLPGMCGRGGGHVVNIGSFSGRVGARGQAAYAAAKAGLIGLTQSLAREAGPDNIRVNAILPGVLDTPMTAGLPAGQLAAFAAANALGRINSLPEVARFVVFLATLENVSGQVFQLDSRIARWNP